MHTRLCTPFHVHIFYCLQLWVPIKHTNNNNTQSLDCVVGCMVWHLVYVPRGFGDISENVWLHSSYKYSANGSFAKIAHVCRTNKTWFHGIIDETHHRLYNHALSHHHTRVIPVFYYVYIIYLFRVKMCMHRKHNNIDCLTYCCWFIVSGTYNCMASLYANV